MADDLILSMSQEEAENSKPFQRKELLYITDNNSNQDYSSSQVIFDNMSFSNNGRFCDYKNGYVLLPMVFTLCQDNNGTTDFTDASIKVSDFVLAIKNSNYSFINGLNIEYNNTSVSQSCQHLNAYLLWQLHSQMGLGDEEVIGDTINYHKDGRNWSYVTTAGSTDISTVATFNPIRLMGHGICNNNSTPIATPHTEAGQNVENNGMYKRSAVFNKMTGGARGQNLIYSSEANMGTCGSNYIVSTNNSKVWYYNAIVPLKLFPFFENFPIVRGAYIKLTFNINTAFFTVAKSATGVLTYTSTATSSTYGQVPLMFSSVLFKVQSNLGTGAVGVYPTAGQVGTDVTPENNNVYSCGSHNLPVGKTYQVSCSIIKNTFTSQQQTGQKHPITSCRLYIPCYTFQAGLDMKYIQDVPIKTIKYCDVVLKTFENISGTFNQTITSSVLRPKRLIIVPFLAKAYNGVADASAPSAFSPILSPFATEPATTSPYLMSQFNVQISGINIYQNSVTYGFEQYLNEMLDYGCQGNQQWGLMSGRISQADWESGTYKYIVVNLQRRIPDFDLSPVSINITGNIISNVAVDLYCYYEYEKELNIQMSNGVISTTSNAPSLN